MVRRVTPCAPFSEYVNRRAEDCPRYRVRRMNRLFWIQRWMFNVERWTFFDSYENRTSLPGSISKSSTSESSVFGLMTSSANFT